MLGKGAQSLPSKAAHQYKALAKLYDAKNYKKGLKHADKLLQTHPDHPETLSLKALFESALGDDDKAEKLARQALLKSKMQSMFCWHTLGSILKQKKNFSEAAKSFQNALKFQKDNMQILRQTAALQIQVRDHSAHVNTRWSILQLKPNMIANWVAFSIAQHLKGNFDQLYKALNSVDNLRLTIQMKPVQVSHYLLYKVLALRDGGRYQGAYEELKKSRDKILDKEIWEEEMYKCCVKLNKHEEAKKCMETLLRRVPQNTEYIETYKGMVKMEDRQFYVYMNKQFGSKISRIFELASIEEGEEFKRLFSEFVKPYYKKNLISLYTEIQIIYAKKDKVKLIEEVFLAHEQSLADNLYPDGEQAESPSEYLWAIYHLSQHYSRNFDTLHLAHEYICKAIVHTNTVSEFYMTKSEIQYKMHSNLESLKTINEARKTDLADRYMNNICIKFLMRCLKPGIAEDVLKLFMRDEASLYELQNQWYIIEAGKSFLRQRKFGPGLKHLHFVEKQFKDMEANQYDFHTYCIRKWTLREYIEFIEFNDNLYKDKKYVQAAAYAMAYLAEYSHYILSGALQKEEEEKIKKEKEKEEENKEKEKEKKKKKKKKKNQPQVEELTPVEAFRKKIDYHGKEYIEKIKGDPMKQALTYAKNIATARYVNKENEKENRLYGKAFGEAINVFIHFNKPLLVIKCLKKLLKTKYSCYDQAYFTIKSIIYLEKALNNEKTDQIIKEIIKEYLFQLKENKDLLLWAQEQIQTLPDTIISPIKKDQIYLALNEQDKRESLLDLYTKKLQQLIAANDKSVQGLQRAFYLCHRLQFYGQLRDEWKERLNEIYGQKTTYFTNWVEEIEKLPASTWTIWWLSEYDQKREEEDQKEKQNEEQKKQSRQDKNNAQEEPKEQQKDEEKKQKS